MRWRSTARLPRRGRNGGPCSWRCSRTGRHPMAEILHSSSSSARGRRSRWVYGATRGRGISWPSGATCAPGAFGWLSSVLGPSHKSAAAQGEAGRQPASSHIAMTACTSSRVRPQADGGRRLRVRGRGSVPRPGQRPAVPVRRGRRGDQVRARRRVAAGPQASRRGAVALGRSGGVRRDSLQCARDARKRRHGRHRQRDTRPLPRPTASAGSGPDGTPAFDCCPEATDGTDAARSWR